MGMVLRTLGPGDLQLVEVTNSSNTAGGTTPTFTATMPPSRQVGDLVVMLVSAYNMILLLPSGWSNIQTSTSGARQRLHAVYKVLTSADVANATQTVGMSGTMDSTACTMLLFRGQNVSVPINASAQGGSTSNVTAHATPTVTTGGAAVVGKALRVRAVATYVAAGANNYSWPLGENEVSEYIAVTAGDATLADISVSVAAVNFVGAQGTVNATSVISRNYGSLTFVISPA